MLHGSKEELTGAARIFLNNLYELYQAGLAGKGHDESAQKVLESNDWVHVYNLGQRLLFINTRDPHFGVLGEMEKEAQDQSLENGFDLRYQITNDGIIFHYVDGITGDYLYSIEIWCIDRAIQGLKLNMPSGIEF